MDIKLDFDPEEIAQKMTEAIINSTFKEMFSKAVEAECKRLSDSNWNTQSVIQNAIQDYFRNQIRTLLDTEYKEKINTLIKAKITDEQMDKICTELVEKIKVESRY